MVRPVTGSIWYAKSVVSSTFHSVRPSQASPRGVGPGEGKLRITLPAVIFHLPHAQNSTLAVTVNLLVASVPVATARRRMVRPATSPLKHS